MWLPLDFDLSSKSLYFSYIIFVLFSSVAWTLSFACLILTASVFASRYFAFIELFRFFILISSFLRSIAAMTILDLCWSLLLKSFSYFFLNSIFSSSFRSFSSSLATSEWMLFRTLTAMNSLSLTGIDYGPPPTYADGRSVAMSPYCEFERISNLLKSSLSATSCFARVSRKL